MDLFYRIRGHGLIPSLSRFYLFFFINLRNECSSHNNRQAGMFVVSFKRVCILVSLFWLLPALLIWNHFGFWLDDLLYPEWSKERVDSPLFIVGNARSGTTWVHRVLSRCRHEEGDFDTSDATSYGLGDSDSDIEDADGDDDGYDDRKNGVGDNGDNALKEGGENRSKGNQNQRGDKRGKGASSSTPHVIFTSMKTWEIIFAPSVSWRRLFHWIYYLDQVVLRSFLFHQLMRLDHYYFGDVKIHPIGLMEPEEDEWVMTHIFLSQLVMFFFPLGGSVLNPVVSFDNVPRFDTAAAATDAQEKIKTVKPLSSSNLAALIRGNGSIIEDDTNCKSKSGGKEAEKAPTKTPLPSGARCEVFDFYKKMVQKHLYEHRTRNRQGGGKKKTSSSPKSSPFKNPRPGRRASPPASKLVFMSKNPPFTMRLQTLSQFFPDMRVLVMVRDPMQSVPSMVSYIRVAWRCFATLRRDDQYPRLQDLLQFCIEHYTYPIEFFKEIDCKNSNNSNNDNSILNRNKSNFSTKNNNSNDNCFTSKIRHKFVSYKSFKQDLSDTVRQTMLDFYGDDIATAHDKSVVQYFLKKQQTLTDNYINDHVHSVDSCCGMSEDKLKQMLQVAYDAHPSLLS